MGMQICGRDVLVTGRGVVIKTASIFAFERQLGLAAYAASKGGVFALPLLLLES